MMATCNCEFGCTPATQHDGCRMLQGWWLDDDTKALRAFLDWLHGQVRDRDVVFRHDLRRDHPIHAPDDDMA
jgi:hypothetical protein